MRIPTKQHRGGAYLVELAFVISLLLLLLIGIFEYSRYLFVKQVIHAAAREGARFAVVNSTITNTLVTDTQAKVLARMSGLDKAAKCNYKCQVYLSDSNGNNIGNATDAGFGQYIAVQIDYDFVPTLPVLLSLKSAMHITTKSMMYSEAN